MWRWILLLIFILILFLLMLRVHFRIVYEGELKMTLRVLFFRFNIDPFAKKVDLKQFSSKGISKKLEKERKKNEAAFEKERKKKLKSEKKPKEKASLEQILNTVEFASDVLKSVVTRFFKYLRINLAKLHLIVATDDAAKTALMYGVAVQSVQYVVKILDNISNFYPENNTSIFVDCDYCSESSSLSLDISLSLRLWHIIAVALSGGAALVLSGRKKSKNKRH